MSEDEWGWVHCLIMPIVNLMCVMMIIFDVDAKISGKFLNFVVRVYPPIYFF